MRKEVLRMQNVTREINGIQILSNINFQIYKGEVMGLLALNSQGKEQLLELICRNLPIRYGRIYFSERLVNSYAHSDSSLNRVSVIGESSRLINNLTVSDNIFVLRRGFSKWFINRRVLNLQVKKLLEDINIRINPGQLVKGLSQFERCTVEILRAMTSGAELIILNNLDSILNSTERKKIFDVIRIFCKEGISFLNVSFESGGLFEICDRIAILDSGKIQKIMQKRDMNEPYIKAFSKFIHSRSRKENMTEANSILEFRNVSTDKTVNLSFTVKKGECTVVLDTNHSRLEEIIALIMGKKKLSGGQILYAGKKFSVKRPEEFSKYNIGIIPADPIPSQIFKNLSYLENLSLFMDYKVRKLISRRKLIRSVEKEYEDILGQELYLNDISELGLPSLYNIVYYRYHLCKPQILFCMQPLSLADVYLQRHILNLIQKLKDRGITIVILTMNAANMLDKADRVLVIDDGFVAGQEKM